MKVGYGRIYGWPVMGGGECLQIEVSTWAGITLLYAGGPYDNCEHSVSYDPRK